MTKKNEKYYFRNGRGLTFPGHNFAGPFNRNFNLQPTNRFDKAAWTHDLGYAKLGPSAYWRHNKWDQILLDKLNTFPNKTLPERIGLRYFQLKKKFTPHLK